LIEIVCALASETIRPPKSSDSNYFSIWNILLYTIAFKSLFQFFEFVSSSIFSSQPQADFFFYLTAATVACGIFLLVIKGRALFSGFSRNDRKISLSKKILLVILLAFYIVLALVPMSIFKSA
jgi:hypothetical protein